MARTGPQKIPGASQTYFYGNGQFSGSAMEVNCGVAHTTEGRTVPSYADSQGRRGANAPTVTGMPDCKAKRIRWYQHYDVDESARALVNKLGGVETNTANAFQMELVGTCDPKTRDAWVRAGYKQDVDFIYWPEAPDWALAEVAWLVRWLYDNHGIPLTCVKDWLAYGKDSRRPGVTPASYGASPARMSMSAWRSFKGWCGHQHVPENDHGDPGEMDFARVIQLAKDTGQEDTDKSSGTPAKNAPSKPEVSLSKLIAAAKSNPAAKGTPVTYAGVRTVEAALVAEGLLAKGRLDGHYGSDTVKAYRQWQLKLYPGASTKPGGAADGIPGKDSLTQLGKKHGFTVTA
ncbi:peptidoglycan-binding domain-containing protein [Streptomyces sp. NPDC042207]|uniref:peptidoglycan-binding domain-containing protein n=1 Tax=Streptomyces sp. NPDC042207 TaxID=3154331 RepID=UPI0033E4DD04